MLIGLFSAMSGDMRYVFFGKVLPERANVHTPSVTFTDPNDSEGTITVSIKRSQVMALASFPESDIQLDSLKHSIGTIAQDVIDTFSFITGSAYSVEITSVLTPDDTMGIYQEGYEIDNNEIPINEQEDIFREMIGLFAGEGGIFLRLCLADFRRSMQAPVDTGFLCFRSVETIRQYFRYAHDLNKKQSWKRLREELDLTREEINFVQEFADPRRHGELVWMREQDRMEVVNFTWMVIDRFRKYLKDISDGEGLRAN